jgi:DNA-binding helix-hairpin-helix protein with protein kinase domain
MNMNLTVLKKLGEGGQGAVYLVEGGSQGQFALKWYTAEQATAEQTAAIRKLVSAGPPRGPAGKRFVWPLDLVAARGSLQFGYLMPLIDTGRYAELHEVQARLKPVPSYPVLSEISYQAANSYRELHLAGLCYRDVSQGNLMFDPRTGDVLICDNDNVGVYGESRSQVAGTLEFMAPELVREETKPSTNTDLHSLAVLLFKLWIWHHPMHGEMEYQYRSWELKAKQKVYGKDPVFIFDPGDRRNRLPTDPDYATPERRWRRCPPSLQALFTQAFTVGLKDPARRVPEGEWQSLFLRLKDGAIACPNCKAENLWDQAVASLACWHCGRAIGLPLRLVFTHSGGRHFVLLTRDARILKRHVDPHAGEGSETVLGQVVQNPANPRVWGIKNLTASPWTAVLPDGTTKEYGPQIAFPLNVGMKVNIAGASAEIVG